MGIGKTPIASAPRRELATLATKDIVCLNYTGDIEFREESSLSDCDTVLFVAVGGGPKIKLGVLQTLLYVLHTLNLAY